MLASHPLAIAITAVVILFLIGGFFVLRRSGRASAPQSLVWGTDSVVLQNPTAVAPSYGTGDVSEPFVPQEANTILRFFPTTASAPTPNPPPTNFASFLDDLAADRSDIPYDTTFDSQILSSYAYIPQGLLNISTQKPRTPEQEALHTYGNAAGTINKDLEANHTDMTDVLDAFFADRESPERIASLKQLAAETAQMGTGLLAIADVPETARSAHAQFAASYQELGEKLALMGETTTDKELLDALDVYNEATVSFSRSFMGLVSTFSLSGVTFSNYEPGSTFTFPGGAGF